MFGKPVCLGSFALNIHENAVYNILEMLYIVENLFL